MKFPPTGTEPQSCTLTELRQEQANQCILPNVETVSWQQSMGTAVACFVQVGRRYAACG
jgi:hypothetical protein